jgi:hypothetical protein
LALQCSPFDGGCFFQERVKVTFHVDDDLWLWFHGGALLEVVFFNASFVFQKSSQPSSRPIKRAMKKWLMM